MRGVFSCPSLRSAVAWRLKRSPLPTAISSGRKARLAAIGNLRRRGCWKLRPHPKRAQSPFRRVAWWVFRRRAAICPANCRARPPMCMISACPVCCMHVSFAQAHAAQSLWNSTKARCRGMRNWCAMAISLQCWPALNGMPNPPRCASRQGRAGRKPIRYRNRLCLRHGWKKPRRVANARSPRNERRERQRQPIA